MPSTAPRRRGAIARRDRRRRPVLCRCRPQGARGPGVHPTPPHRARRVRGLACPTVAGVSGACMGLGVQLALACDLRIATPDALFAVPVAKLGLMVDHWTVQRLALCAGHSTARWMMLTAEPITASRAHQIGLVHSIVEPDGTDPGAAVEAAATELASRIAGLAPLSLQAVKIGLGTLEQGAETVDPDGAFDGAFAAAWSSDDLAEGRRAFAERRPPDFTGH